MKRLRIKLFACGAVFVLTAGVGCASRQTISAESSNPSSTQVVRAKLDNGLQVVLVPNHLAPVATEEMNYLVGSNEAPPDFPGTAHAQEHMMFRGSPELSADQLSRITAGLGGEMNADTQQTVTQYFMTVPSSDLEVALHVEAIRMRGVLDSDALWSKERGAIEQEVASDLSNPSYVLYTRLLGEMFDGTPYAHDALGTTASFDKTSGAMLKKFHDNWYVPNNAVLVIAGDIDTTKVLSEIHRLFGDIPSKPLPHKSEVVLRPVQPSSIEMPTDQPHGYVALAFRLPGFRSQDFAATQVLSDVLSSRRGPLYALVPEGKALFAGFEAQAFPETGLGFAMAAFPKGADSKSLASDLRAALKKAVVEGFPEDLVNAAKLQEATELELKKNSITGLAEEWSDAVAVEGRESPDEDVKAIQAVTVEDLNRAARKYLVMDQSVQAILSPESSGAPVAAKGFGGAESFATSNAPNVTLPDWAVESLSRLSIPRSVVRPVTSTLPNGLHLIIQPETVSDTVSVYGRIKGEEVLTTARGKEGVAQVLDRLFEFGTASLGRVEFQKALDEIGASESAGSGFSVQVLAAHFDRAVALLAENEIHPGLPAEAFRVMDAQVARSVDGRNHSPDYLTKRAATLALVPPKDPRRRQASFKSVSALSLADVKSYHHKAFRPDLTTVVVIGNVDPNHAKEVVEKYFGGWESKGPQPQTELPPIPPNRPSRTRVPDSARSQDEVLLAENLELTRKHPDYYALELGNYVLGGGFYATRLYRDLREELGLVYFVESEFNVRKTRGTYLLTYACDPSNVSKARAIAVHDLGEMRKTQVDPRELDQAKGILLRQISLEEANVASIASGFLEHSLLDLPLDEPTQAAERFLKLDAEQVRAAFAKWLDPARLIEVIRGPS